MGLDIVVEKNGTDVYSFRAGSYSGFNDFRTWLAGIVSVDINKFIGYGGTKDWDGIPFEEFLYHSDCDGELNTEQCLELYGDFCMYLMVAGNNNNDEEHEYYFDTYMDFFNSFKMVKNGEADKLVFC